MGWNGINIEPQATYAEELRLARPRDQTVQAVAGAAPGTCTFHIVESDPDLSTFDPTRLRDLSDDGERTRSEVIEVITLDAVLDEAQPAAIDFLKVDVEGSEREVLLGIDLLHWRPRVIVVEATVSNSQVPNFEKWEDLVLDRGYRYASFDGINRYYVADEEAGLADLLAPANVLDNFVTASALLVDEEFERLRGYIAHLEREIALKNDYYAGIEAMLRPPGAGQNSS